jgi:2-oxoglutarate ferredoxin oxidoreductase subunit gamma
MRFSTRLAGFGGQGLVTAGRILALAAMRRNPQLYVIYTPSYGFATRGSNAMSDVIMDDKPINYPKVTKLDVLVALSKAAYTASIGAVDEKGMVLVDSSILTNLGQPRGSIKMLSVDMAKAAESLGSSIYTSTVVLGVLSHLLPGYLDPLTLEETVLNNLPEKYSEQNKKALELGGSMIVLPVAKRQT